ncbi:MAG: M1 family metallopeptidase [Candidatus Latescibacterota bacterium]|nr:MAG: M1 family metallopeptidase [Candidatus Latescibacterota bacterium]
MLASLVASLAVVAFLPRVLAGGGIEEDKFRQLEEILPTPNVYRSASGAPGSSYWQQRADYAMRVELDDAAQRILGSERITYTNNAPDALRYLWIQLDANLFASDADGALAQVAPDFTKFPYRTLGRLLALQEFDGGIEITRVAAADGADLRHTIVKTMMRIDLDAPLRHGESIVFEIDWNYSVNDAKTIRARTGYEYFEKDDNYIYEIAQFYPRMASYTDVNGWQHKQFIGRGEFTLELGDYEVEITVPADHVVAATGVLQNPDAVLTAVQRQRLREVETAGTLQFIITPEEALANESSRAREKKTWVFHAENVRDFAFASSRKFIWDAQRHDMEGNRVLAMSFYPNEAEPLWSRYSTPAVVHTLNVYSRYTFPYPYPVAISVNGPVGGMEYPMICFNGPRAEPDGTYFDVPVGEDRHFWNRTKYGLISVVIHEVGHNYFPMIVNSDERQWTWMDEGINSFLQFLAEQEWEEDYPSRRGEPKNIVEYMRSDDQVPIMTNSESLLQFGNNAYGKPATALNILRESILGRELFDFAFKEYARRWRFKRPMPADLFRTMEDASGVDLDWFWRGWFYTTDHCDISIENVRLYSLDTHDPDIEKPRLKEEREAEPVTLSQSRFESAPKLVEQIPELKDFYNSYDELDVTPQDREEFTKLLESLEDHEEEMLGTDYKFYVVELANIGGLVMPAILDITYGDGSSEELRVPAEIWRRDPARASKLLLTQREIRSIALDPHLETADVNLDNNHWPRKPIKSRFQLFKEQKPKNPMQKAQEANDDKVTQRPE